MVNCSSMATLHKTDANVMAAEEEHYAQELNLDRRHSHKVNQDMKRMKASLEEGVRNLDRMSCRHYHLDLDS